MSCKEEYEKYIKIQNVDLEIVHFQNYVLPKLLKNNLAILKKIQSNEDSAPLPNSVCRILIQQYLHNRERYR